MSKFQDEKLTFEDQINLIFKSVYQQNVHLSSKSCAKIKEFMKYATQQIIQDAVKRSIRRDASLGFLQGVDLLAAIQKRGEKYKNKIGKYLVGAKSFQDFGQKKIADNVEEEQPQRQEMQAER